MFHQNLSIVKRRETDNYIAVCTCLTTRVTSISHSLVARVRISFRLKVFYYIIIRSMSLEQNKRKTMKNRFYISATLRFYRKHRNIFVNTLVSKCVLGLATEGNGINNEIYSTRILLYSLLILSSFFSVFIVQRHYNIIYNLYYSNSRFLWCSIPNFNCRGRGTVHNIIDQQLYLYG